MRRPPLDLCVFADSSSGEPLTFRGDGLYASDGSRQATIVDGVVEFITDEAQDHFGLQWNRFATVQLDSFNGTTLSRDRLLNQSGLAPGAFAQKIVLDVGCGAGRFTEILLQLGARVVAVDYSAAVHANRRTHREAGSRGDVVFARTSVFALPFRPRSFDIVLCYGVLQHTGDARTALAQVWQMVAPGGVLLVDRYRSSVRNQALLKYVLRPVTKRMDSETLLSLIDRGVGQIVAPELSLFKRLQGGGIRQIARRVLVRLMPNSVFPVMLHLQGHIDRGTALSWSILDTFDMYGPRHDVPQTFWAWRRDLARLEGGVIERCAICGQGNTATVRRIATPSSSGPRV